MVDSQQAVTQRLTAVVDDTLADVDWTITETSDGCQLVLSDRTIGVHSYTGPNETVDWVLTLESADSTVGKFGPFETVADLSEQVQAVLTSDVLYTVCCDG
jgi:hypothetical protein